MITTSTIEISEERQNKAEEQIKKLHKTVDYNTIEYPIEVIVNKFIEEEDGKTELFIPDYQREFAWDEIRQSKFIESILLGLPIPAIYVADNSEELLEENNLETEDLARWEIIDGTQRIRTLARFINQELRLQGLEKLTELEGFLFSDLPLARQRRFKRASIRIIELTEDTDEETRRNLFERINSGSVELNAMEKRRGIRRGKFLDLLDELAKNTKFIELCSFSETQIKYKDPQEYILRFFTFLNNYDNGYESFTKKNITDFLDKYLEETNKINSDKISEMKKEFNRMLNFVDIYFPNGFYQENKIGKKPVTRIKFESLSVGIALALRENPNLKPNSNALYLLHSKEFNDYTKGDASSSKKKVLIRINYVKNMLLGE
ncbi:DUF262 domain-containing protein [Cyanobacterium aponinum FACHB-4101]|uniref:DUF262 domain-containing protein n=1 Tax=Cyanobacterium aponinum TaxID=379064 RepID=UPI001681188F|nr:DUF262 domain-containing protein [Cyanobacterium aponinum]MBD2393042.1 DUF262 domain-containing protein [Cyanobacterium aponinum FACHB-4101]